MGLLGRQTGLLLLGRDGTYLYSCGERRRERIAFQIIEVMGTVNVKHETYISANRSIGSIMKLVEVICGCPGGSALTLSADQSSTESLPAIGRCERSLLYCTLSSSVRDRKVSSATNPGNSIEEVKSKVPSKFPTPRKSPTSTSPTTKSQNAIRPALQGPNSIFVSLLLLIAPNYQQGFSSRSFPPVLVCTFDIHP